MAKKIITSTLFIYILYNLKDANIIFKNQKKKKCLST